MEEHRTSQNSNRGSKGGSGGPISLPVLETPRLKAGPSSKMGWRRSIVLGLVHVVMLIHIAQWLIMGSTISPVEPSEAMKTLELGAVNAGFIFFVLAIISTIIFGRFLCGWGCHVVALQDLCGWMMRKIRVRPKPFRSRLLVWAPLYFGLYMFVWPNFKRFALLPAMRALEIERPVWLTDVPRMHGFSSEMVVTDFWATFPEWYVAIPFFGICGFAAVYFLGAKGFCTYGCPYGGIFGVADKVSPGRIIVNDSCEGCGHCTAVCTSNVRVHEEVRDFGMVVNPGCMKCMDCVSACPNDALRFGFATPSIVAKPRDDEAKKRQAKIARSAKRFDLTWREEIAMVVVFAGMFMSFRGMLNQVPMLMAIGMAGVGSFLAWKLWSILTKPNVRIQSMELKTKGRIRRAGVVYALLALVTIASAAWSGWVGMDRWLGRLDHERIRTPLGVALRADFVPTPAELGRAERGSSLMARSGPWSDGGVGWSLRGRDRRELAFMLLLKGDSEGAITQLRRIIERDNPTAELVQHLAAVMRSSRALETDAQRAAMEDEVDAMLVWALELRPSLDELRTDLALLRARRGSTVEEAIGPWESRLAEPDLGDTSRYRAADCFFTLQLVDKANAALDGLDGSELESTDDMLLGARVFTRLGQRERAMALLERIESTARLEPAQARGAALLLAPLGEEPRAVALLERTLEREPDSVGLRESLGLIALAGRNADAAVARYREAARVASREAWELAALGETIVNAGLGSREAKVVEVGIEAMERAHSMMPDSPTMTHDLGRALLASGQLSLMSGQTEEGVRVMLRGVTFVETASSMAPENGALAEAAAQIAEIRRQIESIPVRVNGAG